ncbi:MAG: NACHT domain-containing protein [Methylobacter sp.]|nr:NACHT domain-containing protein [Methylobacter sp.]
MILQLPAIQAADSQNFVDIRNNHTLLRYFQNIEQQFMYANNFGVAIDDNDNAENGAKAVFLRDLLVRPNLSKYHVTPEQMVSGDAVAELGIADLLAEHQRLFVLGDPGTGKTTLINSLMLAFSYYGDNLTKLALGKRVPFPLILRELPLAKVGNWDDLWQTFLTHNHELLTAPLIQDTDTVNRVLDSGQALIMLDGLDEITHSGQRKQLAAALLEAINRYPHCLFLITSRIIGFDQAEWFGLEPEPKAQTGVQALPAGRGKRVKIKAGEACTPADDFDVDDELKRDPRKRELLPGFYLSPFNLQQVQQFVGNWYQLYVPKQVDHPQRINDLNQRLQANDGLGRLARIPVLLNMICFIHARRGRLPDGRAELYQRIAETYLVSLDKARGLKFKDRELRFDYYDLTEWLAEIAYTLQQQRTEDNSTILMTETEVQAILRSGLAERGLDGEQGEDECRFILEYLSHRSGLFIPRDRELYAFSHLSFLEYFAACHLKLQAPLYAKKDWLALRLRTSEVWWHETFALFFESLDNAKLAERYLTQLFPAKGSDEQQNLLADIVMDTSVRLPMQARQQHIKALAAVCLGTDKPHEKSHVTFRLCTELYQAIVQLKPAKRLSFSGTPFSEFGLLAQLTNLKSLDLDGTPVENLEPVQGLTDLQYLYLNYTAITDLKLLSRLVQLQTLMLMRCPTTDLKPLAQLKHLSSLYINRTLVTDLSPLAELTGLTRLSLRGTPVADLSPLAQLNNLEILNLEDTAITDLSPLMRLESLRELDIRNTASNPEVLSHLPNLQIFQ